MLPKELVFDGRSDIFEVNSVERHMDKVVLHITSKQPEGKCPDCDTEGALHSYYSRRIKDLPIFGYVVMVALRARKFYCPKVIAVSDGDAIPMAQMLVRQLGLAEGISSGANFIAAIIAQEQSGDDSVIATIFLDSNKKYLSTDLLSEEPPRDHYLSGHTRLVGYTPV